MTEKSLNYARDLHSIDNAEAHLQSAASILEAVPAIGEELSDPTVAIAKKHVVIDSIFPHEIRNFFKLLCDNGDFDLFNDIRAAYKESLQTKTEKVDRAKLRYVTAPSDEQLAGIKNFLAKETGNGDIQLELVQDDTLKSGFILSVGTKEYDWSEQGRIEQFATKINKAVGVSAVDESILSILRTNVEDFKLEAQQKEVGIVNWVGDGIANVDGIDHAFYGEIVIFDCGVRGMVQDVRRDEVGVILFGRDTEIKEGSKVVRTGKMAGLPVGNGFLGRIVDALGSPLDGNGEIQADGFRPVECPAPSIVDRQSVSQPMETGLLSIDSMFPIGRGQRELIIGDRQTGKTSIATDTIINQKGKDVICVYVAIGQKASTIAKLVNTLKENGAMDYTIIVSATASDPAPLQYIAPYSGIALAEYFMYKGHDVLIVVFCIG